MHDTHVVRALHLACSRVQRDEPIYTRHSRYFGEDLRWLGSLVGFTHKRFTPYSLRRGGATWHAHKFGSLQHTCLLGRWQSEKTAKIYINGAAAEWASWKINRDNRRLLRRATKVFRDKFAGKNFV